MKPLDKIPTWKAEGAMERVQACALFLKVHGFISDAERQRLHKRMLKWIKASGYSFAPVAHQETPNGK